MGGWPERPMASRAVSHSLVAEQPAPGRKRLACRVLHLFATLQALKAGLKGKKRKIKERWAGVRDLWFLEKRKFWKIYY
jgi:hypothetical protein